MFSANRLILHSVELPVSMPPNRSVNLVSTAELVRSESIKNGTFVGPQIPQLIKDIKFEEKFNDQEKLAWKCFVSESRDP